MAWQVDRHKIKAGQIRGDRQKTRGVIQPSMYSQHRESIG
jgi:hypothetical protein